MLIGSGWDNRGAAFPSAVFQFQLMGILGRVPDPVMRSSLFVFRSAADCVHTVDDPMQGGQTGVCGRARNMCFL